MSMATKIKGLDSLRRKLDDLPQQIQRGAVAGRGAAADELAEQIRQDAPVDTGELSGSVESRPDDGEVAVTAAHGWAVEVDQPYAGPAVDRSGGAVVERVSEAIRRELP